MTELQSIRTTISDNKDELVIYAADNFAQFPRRDALAASKCDRALAFARAEDLVVLRQLPCFGTSRTKANTVNHIVQTGFQQLQQIFTGGTFELRRMLVVVAKLAFKNPVYTA